MENLNQTLELLDPTSCKAFWHAARELNFSLAAEKAGMTQPGISKHILKLEERLKSQLFIRSPKGLILTKSGELLREYVSSMFIDYEKICSLILEQEFRLEGEVRYAMPESCLMSPHFGMLLKEREKHFPKIHLCVSVATNDVIEDMILNDKVDFGFLTQRSEKFICESFCEEEYILTSSSPMRLESLEDLKELQFIGSPDLKIYYEKWLETFFQSRGPRFNELKVVNSVSELRGVITMLTEGNKNHVTIMPRHGIMKEMESENLYDLNPSEAQCKNQIYMGYLDKSFSLKVNKVKEEFFKLLL